MVFTRNFNLEEISHILTIQEFAREAHKNSESHDYSHVLTVCRISIQIAKALPEPVDPFIVTAGALLHDIGKTNNLFTHMHGLLGGALAEEFLSGMKIEPEIIESVCRVIVRHSPTSMIPPETVEEKIVFDADTIDRLGLIGLIRGFIGKSGSMPDIIMKYNKSRMEDFKKLHFEISRQMGDARNEELGAYIEIIQNHLKLRLKSIEDIFRCEDLIK